MTKVKTEVRMLLSLFKSAEAIRRWDKDPVQWIVAQIPESKMAEAWAPTEAWAEFTPYLASAVMCGPFEQRGGLRTPFGTHHHHNRCYICLWWWEVR